MNLSNYRAVLLAGGKGTRLYPITREIPKPLLPVKRKPIINYLVDLFREQGIREIAVLISKDFKEDFEWWRRRYYPSASSGQAPSADPNQIPRVKLVEEKTSLGTFGGLFLLEDWLAGSPFFLSNADEIKKIDLRKMADFHQKSKTPATIALVKVKDPQNYGVVVCESNIVKEFLEKPKNPPSQYVNSGLYLLSSEILKHLSNSPKFLMTETDIFPSLAKEKKLAGFKFDGFWTDCGTWERYSQALQI